MLSTTLKLWKPNTLEEIIQDNDFESLHKPYDSLQIFFSLSSIPWIETSNGYLAGKIS